MTQQALDDRSEYDGWSARVAAAGKEIVTIHQAISANELHAKLLKALAIAESGADSCVSSVDAASGHASDAVDNAMLAQTVGEEARADVRRASLQEQQLLQRIRAYDALTEQADDTLLSVLTDDGEASAASWAACSASSATSQAACASTSSLASSGSGGW